MGDTNYHLHLTIDEDINLSYNVVKLLDAIYFLSILIENKRISLFKQLHE